ncbi:MAG: diguanylate cyclase [Erysipelotrichaceae bacterium]|nr:diguanylate cyclase [Erysipelotrichaceae bacterium]
MGSPLYLLINVFGIASLSILYGNIQISGDYRYAQRLFCTALLLIIALFGLDAIWYMIASELLNAPLEVSRAVNCGYFGVSGFVGYFWVQYVINELNMAKQLRIAHLWVIPAIAHLILSIGSFWGGWFFFVDSAGVYHRGTMFLLHLILAYGPSLYITVLMLFEGLRFDSYVERNKRMVLASFLVPVLICETIQILLETTPMLCIGLTLGCLLIYMNMQSQLISLDPLTNLNNRNQLDRYLSVHFDREMKDGQKLYAAMIDVDCFRSINDAYGPREGDQALIAVSDALKFGCDGTKCFASRYFDDEFVIISESADDTELKGVCRKIISELRDLSKDRPYDLDISIGIAEQNSSLRNGRELLQAADEALYFVKKTRKSKR